MWHDIVMQVATMAVLLLPCRLRDLWASQDQASSLDVSIFCCAAPSAEDCISLTSISQNFWQVAESLADRLCPIA